jgi:hypothetical protein
VDSPVYCPKCNGPGKIEYRWTGEAFAVCDAYRPCGYDLAEAVETRELLRRMEAAAEQTAGLFDEAAG